MPEATLQIEENNNLLKVVDNHATLYVEDDGVNLVVTPEIVNLKVPNDSVKILSIGVQGPAGVTSVNDSHHTHTQLAASSLWTVVHNMGKYPSVMVVDSGDNVVIGEIHYLTNNSLEIAFSAPFGGKAYLN